MAANRVGALYYEAILDPRGFARGVLKVRNDQAVLASAIKDTSTPIERLQAELHVLDRIYEEIAGKDPFEGQQESLDALVKKTMMLADEVQRLEDAPRIAAEQEEAKRKEEEHAREVARQEDIARRYAAIASARQARFNQEQAKKAAAHQEELSRLREEESAKEAAHAAQIERLNTTFAIVDEMRRKREAREAKEAEDRRKREAEEAKAAEDAERQKQESKKKTFDIVDWMSNSRNQKQEQADAEREQRERTFREAAEEAFQTDQQNQRDAAKQLEQLQKQQESKQRWLDGVKKKTQKADADARRKEIEHESRMKRLQTERMAKRLSSAGQYMTSFKGMKILFADLTKSVGGVTGGLSKMAGNLAQAAGMGPQVQGLARVFGALGLKVLGVVAAIYAIGKALASAAMAADEFEQRQIKIKAAMGGNEIRARALTDEMDKYAAKTSYTSEQMQDFSARLLTLGVSARKIPDIAQKLGGLAMGDPERLKLVGKAYADVMTKGRLMAQEANQFANANIPIYQALSDITGKTVATVQKMTEQGQISAEMVDQALQRIRETTGADAAMAERSETIAGLWDEIRSSAQRTWRIIGGPIQNSIVTLLKLLAIVVKSIESGVKFFEIFIQDLDFALGKFYNMSVIAKKIWMIMTGQYAELVRQAKEEGDIADLKREQEAAARAQLEVQEKQNANYEEMRQQLADELQGYYDRFNEEEKLAEIQFERMLKEKLMMGEITQEQADQLRNQRSFVEREKERLDLEKQRADEAKKAAEDEKKEQLKIDKEYRAELDRIDKEEAKREEQLYEEAKEREAQIEQQIKDKMGVAKEADAGAGASFEAGSVEEFNMLRQMEMQARRDAQQVIFEEEAKKSRQESNRILSQMLLNMQSDAQKEREDAQWNYYGN